MLNKYELRQWCFENLFSPHGICGSNEHRKRFLLITDGRCQGNPRELKSIRIFNVRISIL